MITTIGLLLLLAGVALAADGWTSFGRSAGGERQRRVQRSSRWSGGKFRNDLPLRNFAWRSVVDGISRRGRHKRPDGAIRPHRNDGSIYRSPPGGGLRVTWLGHSTLLLEVDGATVLIDPVWGQRTSPFSRLGPRRWYESPLAIENLPHLDAVLISHDHYDHLDRTSVVALKSRVRRFVVPLGVGSHLEYWGVPASCIEELDWWEESTIGEVRVTATPARHASGRHVFDLDRTLWTGFAIRGPVHNVYYSGDSGLFPGFKDIGERLGPFDLAMIEVGAYNRNWPDWHLGPEQAVLANQWVKAKRLLPVHWGLFDLALHSWTEPVERVLTASAEHNLAVLTPMPGQPVEPGITDVQPWWPALPWEPASSHAIRSSGVDLAHHELGTINGGSDPRMP